MIGQPPPVPDRASCHKSAQFFFQSINHARMMLHSLHLTRLSLLLHRRQKCWRSNLAGFLGSFSLHRHASPKQLVMGPLWMSLTLMALQAVCALLLGLSGTAIITISLLSITALGLVSAFMISGSFAVASSLPPLYTQVKHAHLQICQDLSDLCPVVANHPNHAHTSFFSSAPMAIQGT